MAFHPMVLNDPVVWALPPSEFKLYVALLSFADPDGTNCYPTNERLATRCGCSARSIQTQLASLEERGVIERRYGPLAGGKTRREMIVKYAPVVSRGTVTFVGTGGEDDDAPPDSGGHGEDTSAPGTQPAAPTGVKPAAHNHAPDYQIQRTSPKRAARGREEPFEALAGAELPTVVPVPGDMVAIASRCGPQGERWVFGKLNGGGIGPTDWRLSEVLSRVHGRGIQPHGVGYFETIFRGLPVEPVAPPQPPQLKTIEEIRARAKAAVGRAFAAADRAETERRTARPDSPLAGVFRG